MAKKGRGGKRKRKRGSSSLGDHQRQEKTLVPPLKQLPQMQEVSWTHEGLPDILWLAAVEQETGHLPAAHQPLDALDEFVPEGTQILDGRLSRFALIPEARRAEARGALIERAAWGLPDALGHALALYPDCPAAWLYEEWAEENSADPEIGAGYLKRLVAPLLDPKGPESSRLRLMVLARYVKHGKVHVPPDSEFVTLMPKYPYGLDEEERRIAESLGRAMWNGFFQMDDESIGQSWAEYFWRHSWHISQCEPWESFRGYMPAEVADGLDEDDSKGDEDASPQQAAEMPSLPELCRAFSAAVAELGKQLRVLADRCEVDLYEPTPDEVKLGLASRHLRLLQRFVEDFRLWTAQMGPHLARSMIDTRIVTGWLLKKNNPELYGRFKEYGIGKRKLFKLQIEEFIDNDDFEGYEGLEAIHRRLEAEVNVDKMEEFQTIDLGGGFSGKNIREMAIEAGLKDLYVLNFQPYSTEVHGEWGSLMAFDLEPCGNPLHRHHRRPAFGFGDRDRVVHPGWVRHLCSLAWESIDEIFGSYGLDVDPPFEACLEAFSAAMGSGDRTEAE